MKKNCLESPFRSSSLRSSSLSFSYHGASLVQDEEDVCGEIAVVVSTAETVELLNHSGGVVYLVSKY